MNTRKIITYILLTLTISLSISCTTVVVSSQGKSNPSDKVPPGQQKKAAGSKSAKPYAPGQQKKK